MPQRRAWENEYRDPKLLSKSDEPRTDLKDYVRFLRRQEKTELDGLRVLDLGSGTGRNAIYCTELGARVTGLEIAPTAIMIAKERAREAGALADFQSGDVGSPYPFADATFDVVLDIMTTNSLNEKERAVYLEETHRVLAPGGHLFVRTLCKDGDTNAKNLLKLHPGPEYDTYINTDMDLVERVFSKDDLIALYAPYFEIQKLERKTNYARFKGRVYKRNYWIACMKKARH